MLQQHSCEAPFLHLLMPLAVQTITIPCFGLVSVFISFQTCKVYFLEKILFFMVVGWAF